MAMPLVRCRRHALCKKAKGAPLLHWVQFRRTSNSNSKSKTKAVSGCFSCCGTCCLVSPLAPLRECFIVGGCWVWYLVVDLVVVVVLCVMAIQHNGMGVPASPSGVFRLRFAPVPPKKPAGLPSSPPNARGPVPLSALYPRSTWGDLRCRSAGHSQQVVTGLKSTFLKAPRKSPDATCGAVQADTPLRYVTAFKLSIGERNEKNRGRAAPHDERRARHFAALRDWP